jgi:hypothetical protein
VHALLGRVEIDRALDLGGDQLLDIAVANADRLAHSGHACAGDPELHVGQRRLQVVEQSGRIVHRGAHTLSQR